MQLAARVLLLGLLVPGAWSCAPRAQALPGSSAKTVAEAVAERPKWAEPLERPGLPNLHRVSPLFYRGAQPTEEGFRELAHLGVKSVISLRAFHSDEIPIDAGLKYERIAFKAWHPEDEDVVRFLRLVSDPARQPVFVHCQWGSDRTGMMCAIARVALDGWTKEQALEEMTQGEFGFHPLWDNLIEYVREADIEKLARKAGLRK